MFEPVPPAPGPTAERTSPNFWKDKRFFASTEARKENPRRKGVAGHYSLNLIIEAGDAGLSYAEWNRRFPEDMLRNTHGTRHYHLQWDWAHENITLEIDQGPPALGLVNELARDLRAVDTDPEVSETTRRALVEARLGQGEFRGQLNRIWENSCAVTGCKQLEVLRASHMKPWRYSTNAERLDPNNGLLLSANIDALFDRLLVSFTNDGAMLVSQKVTLETRELLGLPAHLRRTPNSKEIAYLEHHQTEFAKFEAA